MTYEEMEQLQEDLFGKIRAIRGTKGREYAHDADTLADFKEAADEAGVTPLQCWLTYVSKHQRAIAAYVRTGGTLSESIEDRVLDVIVYHVLLLGLTQDLEPISTPMEQLFDSSTWQTISGRPVEEDAR